MKNCPIGSTGFCWKNPLQLAVFLAVLPYAAKGVVWVVDAIRTVCCN